MRSGSGRIVSKLASNSGEILKQINVVTNIQTRSQVKSSKTDRLTQLDSSHHTKHSSRLGEQENEHDQYRFQIENEDD